MNDKIKTMIPFSELQAHDRLIVQKICTDDKFAYDFFHTKCRPLISKIIWKIFNNEADYDALVNSLFEYMRAPGENGDLWHKLIIFDYRTSLFDWVRISATRYFRTSGNEKLNFPDALIESGIAEEMISFLNKPILRKYMMMRYIDKLPKEEILEEVHMEKKELQSMAKNAIWHFKVIVQNHYPEYLSTLFTKDGVIIVDIDDNPEANHSSEPADNTESALDAQTYLNAMPNETYKYVIRSLFLDDKNEEELAEEMNMRVSNIYNLKLRGIDQLRDIAIHFKEVPHFEKYINLVKDDTNRYILDSIFVKKKSYEEVCNTLHITEAKFKKIKKDAIKDIKKIIFKKKNGYK